MTQGSIFLNKIQDISEVLLIFCKTPLFRDRKPEISYKIQDTDFKGLVLLNFNKEICIGKECYIQENAFMLKVKLQREKLNLQTFPLLKEIEKNSVLQHEPATQANFSKTVCIDHAPFTKVSAK